MSQSAQRQFTSSCANAASAPHTRVRSRFHKIPISKIYQPECPRIRRHTQRSTGGTCLGLIESTVGFQLQKTCIYSGMFTPLKYNCTHF